jgi:hypothetical protein
VSNDDDISSAVREFMLAYVRTYEQLEALLVMSQSPDRSWTAQELAQTLKLSLGSADEALRELAHHGVLALEPVPSPAAYRLPASDVSRTIAELGQIYADNRLLIMRVMNENAVERVRTDALRAFSNAFVIRGKENDG